MLNWQAAGQAIIHHPLFSVGLTLIAFQMATWLYAKTRLLWCQPFLVAMTLVISVLLLCQISYEEYRQNNWLLTVWLGPATVALAIPLYLNLTRIRQLFKPIILTLIVGGSVTSMLVFILGWLFGTPTSLLMTLAPKSATSPIAMLVAENLGGIAALAAVFVLLTGVLGAMIGPWLLNKFQVHNPAARGMALGLTAHAVGTAQALHEGEECGAFAAMAMSLMGVLTAVALPVAIAVLG